VNVGSLSLELFKSMASTWLLPSLLLSTASPAGTLSAALAAAAGGDTPEDGMHGPSGGPGHSHAFVAGVDGLRGLAATCSELEQVLFAQQLILFAPDAVPPTKHLPLLLLTLGSSRPTLRKAAAATLWHLADRKALALAQVGRVGASTAHWQHTCMQCKFTGCAERSLAGFTMCPADCERCCLGAVWRCCRSALRPRCWQRLMASQKLPSLLRSAPR
jgi:hypothetical protein